MEKQGKLRVGIAGWGSSCVSYVRSLTQIDSAQALVAVDPYHPHALEISRIAPSLAFKGDVLTLVSGSDVDAVIFCEPTGNIFPLLKRALQCNKHVMASPASAISSRQLQELARLAGRQRRLLMFAEERLFHPALTFLRRMLSEKSGLWRPQYLRGLSISGTSNGDAPPFASLVEEALALCARLIEAQPDTISGIACRTSGHADPVAAFLNLTYGEGKVASLQISVGEAQEVRQWVLATASKTILVDECDPRAPLRIISSNATGMAAGLLHSNPPTPLSDWPGESTVTPPVIAADPATELCRHFVESALKRDLNQSNALFWAEVASTWEAAQQSMALSGAPVGVTAGLGGETARKHPQLKLIRGRGVGNISQGKRPILTVVSR